MIYHMANVGLVHVFISISGNKKQNIIMVASLIDKTPNLGGLARTCEV